MFGNLAFVLLGAAILFTIVAIGVTSQYIPITSASGRGPQSSANISSGNNGPQRATCGVPGLPTCPTTSSWIALRSETPANIIAAARQSPHFRVNRSGNGDFLHDLSHLGTPVFVHALTAPGKATAPDFYVIPVEDRSGSTIAAAEVELNASHTSVLVMAIVTYTYTHPRNTIARMSQQDAVNRVQSQAHTMLRTNFQPQLVYFPVDGVAQQTGKIVWVSGGEYPADPIWLIPGADGQDHVVGADGHVYLVSELPIMAAHN